MDVCTVAVIVDGNGCAVLAVWLHKAAAYVVICTVVIGTVVIGTVVIGTVVVETVITTVTKLAITIW